MTDRPTDDATRSVTIGGSNMRSTVMWSNNDCSICRLLDFCVFIIKRSKAIVDSRLRFARGVELHAELYISVI